MITDSVTDLLSFVSNIRKDEYYATTDLIVTDISSSPVTICYTDWECGQQYPVTTCRMCPGPPETGECEHTAAEAGPGPRPAVRGPPPAATTRHRT